MAVPGCGCREMNGGKKKHITWLLSYTLINVTAPFDLVTFSFNGTAALRKKRADTLYTVAKCVIGVWLNIAVITTDLIVDEVKGKGVIGKLQVEYNMNAVMGYKQRNAISDLIFQPDMTAF